MRKKKKRRTGRLVLLSLAIGFVVFGLWFSGTNSYKFLKGYLLFKSGEATTETVTASQAEPKPAEGEPVKKSSRDLYEERPDKGEEFGNLYIPKLEANLPIFHGTDEDELEKGVGHFAGSVLPGERDNSVLSGHRDTVFRKLGEVGKGDVLMVTTSAGEFTYKVRQVKIVDADDRTIIVPKPRATLTVTTCYPFDFIGDAPDRYILVADLIESNTAM